MATRHSADQMNQYGLRIADIALEPLTTLPPITGYIEMPIVSLEKVVEPLISLVSDVVNHAHIAKLRCAKPPPEGLTLDQSAAIMLYTMSWKPYDQCFYIVLNAALRNEDRSKLEPWHPYLKLLLTALDNLPSIHMQTVYRGTIQEIQKKYHKGKLFMWWGFSSCAISTDILKSEELMGTTVSGTIFAINSKTGKDIRKHSFHPTEDEILLLPATEFKVDASVDDGQGLFTISLTETASYASLQQRPLASGSTTTSDGDEDDYDDEIVEKNMLIWLDSNNDVADKNCRKTIATLKQIIEDSKPLNDLDKAVEEITQSSDKNIFLITSGAFGAKVVPIIHELPQIASIFVFCGNKSYHEQWANKWSKIKGVHTTMDDLYDKLKDAI